MAFTCAAAAAILEMTAAVSLAAVRGGEEAGSSRREADDRLCELRDRAAELRGRATALADQDAEAYGRVIEARQGEEKRAALEAAAQPPLELETIAREVAALAAEGGRLGKASVRADADCARVLAEAAASAAAALAAVNLGHV